MNKLDLVYLLGSFCLSVPGISQDRIFEEINGRLLVEAEAYDMQSQNDIRKWYIIGQEDVGDLSDVDVAHTSTASGGKYLEILPDTRTNHDEKLIHGENFSNEPGKLAVLDYRVKINTPGRYYVWVKAFSTGTEDNGIHVGLNGSWPESGQRMQWCEGKNTWTWASKQRTQEVHCGVEKLIYLDIPSAGNHVISFSMRDDCFAFDQWALSSEYESPREW